MSPSNKRKSLFSKRTGIDITKRKRSTRHNSDVASSIRENTIKDSLLLKNPVVILQRLPNILFSGSQKISNTTVDKSWKILESNCTRISLNNKNHDTRNSRSSSNLPLKFSTPRTKQPNWNGGSTSNRNRISHSLKNNFDANNCNPLDVREVTTLAIDSKQGKARQKNKSYELIEPETPTLRRELYKIKNKKGRTTNSNVKETKKILKVNLERLSKDMNHSRIPVLQSLRYKKKLTEKSNDRIVAITENKNIKGTTSQRKSQFQRKSPFQRKSINSMNIKSVTLLAGLHNKSKINTRLSPTVKKLDLKHSTPKKLPNFAEIHEKLFAKSESLVDAQRRLRERHTTLRTLKTNNLPISNLIQKTVHYHAFQPKTNLDLRSKCQQENREFLKGVRTNRRFELQMKSRNMNLK